MAQADSEDSMVTIMIVTDSIKENELIASSIIGGFNNSIGIIATTDMKECESIIGSRQYDIDIFFIRVKMKNKGGRKLAEYIRDFRKYKETPIVFITSIMQNAPGCSELATYQGYKKETYLVTPIHRIDVQGKIGLYLDRIISESSNKNKHDRVLFIEHSKGESFVEVKSIRYAEVQNKVVSLYTMAGEYQLKRTALDRFCKMVDCDCLKRCHKSFAVNVNEIKDIVPEGRRNWSAIFPDGSKCLISSTYYPEIRKLFYNRLPR